MLVKTRRGFTLIELLVVVVILGILAGLAIPRFAATKDKAKLATVKSDLKNIQTAQEAYFYDYSSYTGALSATIFSPSTGNTSSMTGTTASFTATVSNGSIVSTPRQCSVTVGSGSTTDGVMLCS